MIIIPKRIVVKYFMMLNIGLFAVLAFNSCSKEKQLIKLMDGTWSATPSGPVDSSSTIIVLEYTFDNCNSNEICTGSYLFEIFGADTTIDFTWELNSELLTLTVETDREVINIIEWEDDYMKWQPYSLTLGETIDLVRIK